LEVLSAASYGSLSPIPRTVKYILTTLAQYRVLQGYGMGSTSDLVLDIPEKETSAILTKNDVELALNLALLLEISSLFRDYDEQALEAIDENVDNWKDEDIGNTKMHDLVKNYVTNKTVDAADIIALYLGIESRTINLKAIITQALYAMADQFVLKYLDYFHLMDIYDAALKGVQFLSNAIELGTGIVDDFFGYLSGESEDDENYNRVKKWVKETLTKKGELPNTTIMHDTSVDMDPLNYSISLSKNGECQHLEDHDNNASTPNILVTHTWSTSVDYDLEAPGGNYEVDFQKKDILRNSVKKLWYDPESDADFYDAKYAINVNEIYKGVRHVVKLICAEIVDILTDMTDLDLSSYMQFSRPLNLNPKDNVSLLEEIKDKVYLAMEAVKNYFSGSTGRAKLRGFVAQLVDEHAKAKGVLQTFLIENFDELADKENNIKFVKETLASHLISISQIAKTGQSSGGEHPDCAPFFPFSDSEVREEFLDTREEDVENDILPFLESAYEEVKTQELLSENNGRSGMPLYIIGALQNTLESTENIILDLFVNQIHGFGFIPSGCDMVKLVAGDIIYGGEVVNTKFLQYTKVGVPFEFWEDDYNGIRNEKNLVSEIFSVDQEPDYLRSDDELEITISKPKGTHYTVVGGVDLVTASAFGNAKEDFPDAIENMQNSYKTRPFVTNWEVKIGGEVEVTTSSESRLFLLDGGHKTTKGNRTCSLDMGISIVVYSGWNLKGVNYELSDTLLGDICEFLNKVWDYIVSVVGAVFDVLTKLIESFMDLLTKLISYIAELIKLIVDTIQFLVELIKDFVQTIMDTIVKDMIEAISNVIKNGITISFLGWTFAIKGNKSIAENQSADGDLLTVSTKGSVFNIDINFTLRFARYHKEDDDKPHYDILLDSQFTVGNFNLNITVDPLMVLQSYIVEGHGKSVSDKGTGWGIDFYAPEIEEYKEVKYCLGDVASGMNSIPIPFLGLRATVDCGFIIHYNAPKGTDVVINEFELNPEGPDAGAEWFEIYDPGGILGENWSVSSTSGGLRKYPLSDLEWENDDVYTVYTLADEVLQNGKKLEPFEPGDGLILYDEEGNVIDKTPKFKEPGEGNSSTWQRTYDGGAIWKKKEQTQLAQNAPEKFDMKQEIMDALKSSFQVAWSDFAEKELSIDAIIELIQDWIHNFIEMVLTLILDVVQRVFVYIDLALEDATGSAGGGFRLSLGMDGEGVVILLRWIIDTIETFIRNILNPANCQDFPTIPNALFEHMFIRFELYFRIGTPKIIKRISKDPPAQSRLAIAIQANVPALVNLLGWDWGDWEVVFGVFLDHFPSKALSKTFGTSDDDKTFVDLWLFKARIYEIT
jgi:hypothetical protein